MNKTEEIASCTSSKDNVTIKDEVTELTLEESDSRSIGNTSANNGTENKPTQHSSELKVKRTRRSIKPYSNDSLQIALTKCREGLSLRECSKLYGIPRSTLWDKLSGKASRNRDDISNAKLSVPIAVENR